MKRELLVLAGAALLVGAAVADDVPALRPSARLLFGQPELMQPGSCVIYREGGSGWILGDPVYWLKGRVVLGEIRSRRLQRCPEAPGKLIEQYSRDEFNRLANAYPCVRRDDPLREEQFGIVRLRVEEWETPWAKRTANAGRLYQGHFIDRALDKGVELEIEADLLSGCDD